VQSSSVLQDWIEEDCDEFSVHSLPSQGNSYGGPSVNTQVFCSQETVVLPHVREQDATVPSQGEQKASGIGQSETFWHCVPVEDRDELVQAPAPQVRVKFPSVAKWHSPGHSQTGKSVLHVWEQAPLETAQGVHISGRGMSAQSLLSSQTLLKEEVEEAGSLQHVVLSPQTFPAPLLVPPAAPHRTLSMQEYPGGQPDDAEELNPHALGAHSFVTTCSSPVQSPLEHRGIVVVPIFTQ
jgi:hypothetical protein